MLKILLTALLPFYLSLIGYFFWSRIPRISNYLIPIFGFVSLIISIEALSNILKLPTLQAIWIATAFLIILSCISIFKNHIVAKSALAVQFKVALIYYLVLGVMTLTGTLYGTFNFDFFYNTLDSVFLQNNSLFDYSNSPDVFPLTWSADQMGRYGISFLIAFLNEFLYAPTYWAGACFVLMILLSIISSSTLIKALAGPMRGFFKYFAIFITIFNPLTLTGWHYALLGQTSGWPVFLLLLIVLIVPDLERSRSHYFALSILVVSLFWIYPAHLMVAIPLVVLFLWRDYRSKSLTQLPLFLFSLLGVAALTIGLFPNNAYEKFTRLFLYSSSTGADSKIIPSVFNQFSSNVGPLISSGYLTYPVTQSSFEVFLFYSLLLIAILFLAINLTPSFKRSNFSYRNLSNIQIVSFYFILWYLFVFAVIRSNYLIFKISIWFMPLLFGLAILSLGRRQLKNIALGPVFLVFAVVLTLPIQFSALVTINKALDRQGVSFPWADQKYAVELSEIIKSSKSPVYLRVPSAEEAGWLSLHLPEVESKRINYAAPPRQVLGVGFEDACMKNTRFQESGKFVWTNRMSDIFPGPILNSETVQSTEHFRIVDIADVSLFVSQNAGVFYPERSNGWPFPTGEFFRWSNGTIAFSIWSSSPKLISLDFSVMKGPDLETLEFNKSTNGDIEFSSQRDSIAKVEWNNLSVDRGWNCIKVSSRNTPKQISYSSSRPDFRPLAFAIGEVRVRILNVNR